jgi:hypothetical protein
MPIGTLFTYQNYITAIASMPNTANVGGILNLSTVSLPYLFEYDLVRACSSKEMSALVF